MKKALLSLLFACSANVAYADTVVVDFDSLASSPTVFIPTYLEDGYLISVLPSTNPLSDADPNKLLSSWGSASGSYLGSPALLSTYLVRTITLTRTDSQSFNLSSIDLAGNLSSWVTSATPFNVTFVGLLLNGGTISQTFTLDDPLSFSTFNFTGFDSVVNVSWEQGNAPSLSHQFDNLVLSTGPSRSGGAAAVPEPETYAMFLAGLGLMGFVSRRKKSSKN